MMIAVYIVKMDPVYIVMMVAVYIVSNGLQDTIKHNNMQG
jgi:hypothetical protein